MREAKIAAKVGDAAARVSDVKSRDSTDYPWPAINLLDALVPSDAIAWFCMTKDTAELIGFPGERPDGEVAQQLVELSSDHPMMLSYQAEPTRIEPRAPRRLSDLVSDRQLRRTQTYSELLRPVDRIRQVTLMSTVDQRGTWISWTLNRRRMNFTDDELATLSQLRPTLSLLDSYAAPARHSRLVSAQVGEDLGLTRREVEVLECI